MNKKAYIIFFVCRHRWYTRTYTQYRLDRHTHTHTYRLAKKPELLGQQHERHVSFSFFSPTHAQHSHLSDVHFDGLYIHIIRVFWAWSTSIASLKWWLTASFECECVRRFTISNWIVLYDIQFGSKCLLCVLNSVNHTVGRQRKSSAQRKKQTRNFDTSVAWQLKTWNTNNAEISCWAIYAQSALPLLIAVHNSAQLSQNLLFYI